MTAGATEPGYVLGISAYYHDSAACLLKDGQIVAAAQEERFSRQKHDPRFPKLAVEYCLGEAGITAPDLRCVAFYEKPFVKFERLMTTFFRVAPRGLRSFLSAMPVWLGEKLWLPQVIRDELDFDGDIVYADHHESHASSAFYPSPFEEAAVLTSDGVGEWTTTSFGRASRNGRGLELLGEQRFPHSLGMLYSAFTYYTGFRVNSGEYKVMGLAPYGRPRFRDRILDNLLDLKDDSSFRLDMRYFDFLHGQTMTNGAFHDLFEGPPRKPEDLVTEKEMDLARSVQEVTEEVMLRQVRHVHDLTGLDSLCLAGGVALNCVANGRILREGPFSQLWVQPAAGDAGGALGAAYVAATRYLERPVATDANGKDHMQVCRLGPEFGNDAIERAVEARRCTAERLTPDGLVPRVAELLEAGNVVGFFQDRMEYGPRALGCRSIVADPRRSDMQSKLNLKIKFRESFRPFAPAVLLEDVSDYFELDQESPYMLIVAPVVQGRRKELAPEDAGLFGIELLKRPRSDVPAITHVDFSARVQTVEPGDGGRFGELLGEWRDRTGCSVLVNTSFNVRGEPIVCDPDDAIRCFLRTEMDVLAIGDFILEKPQPDADVSDINVGQLEGLD